MKTCKDCLIAKPLSAFYVIYRRGSSETLPRCKGCEVTRTARAREKMRETMLVKYANGGIPACSLCNNTDREVLGLDHIAGGGNAERKAYGAYVQGFYRKLAYSPKRDDLRILCRNCNWKEYLRHVRRFKAV